jgi:carbon-monoxide dehydrogenase large subunit
VYDDDCQLLVGTLADYLMPTAADFPQVRAILLENSPSPSNPLGAKGAGEGGTIPVAGVVSNAVAAALASLEIKPNSLPITPSRLWGLIQASPVKDGFNKGWG